MTSVGKAHGKALSDEIDDLARYAVHAYAVSIDASTKSCTKPKQWPRHQEISRISSRGRDSGTI